MSSTRGPVLDGIRARLRAYSSRRYAFLLGLAVLHLGLMVAAGWLVAGQIGANPIRVLVIGLLGVVLWRGLRIASRAADPFGRLVAGGVVAWLAFQSFINIGMTLGIMPVTGLPLPFVSYGGSSMFACLVAVGLLQGVHLRSSTR